MGQVGLDQHLQGGLGVLLLGPTEAQGVWPVRVRIRVRIRIKIRVRIRIRVRVRCSVVTGGGGAVSTAIRRRVGVMVQSRF